MQSRKNYIFFISWLNKAMKSNKLQIGFISFDMENNVF